MSASAYSGPNDMENQLHHSTPKYVSQTNYGIYIQEVLTENSFHKQKIVMFYESYIGNTTIVVRK